MDILLCDYCCSSDKQGLVTFNNVTSEINTSVFNPSQLTENRMLYFWISDGFLDPIMGAAHHDGRFIRNIYGTELTVWYRSVLDVFLNDESLSLYAAFV